MNILLTGGTGFVGGAIKNRLVREQGHLLTCAVRKPENIDGVGLQVGIISGLTGDTDWSHVLEGQDIVIHSAARVHVMKDSAADPLLTFREINVDGSIKLARQAAQFGIRRFVYISSIKVNGEATYDGGRFTAFDKPAPIDPYGISKLEAEEGLKIIAAQTGMEVVIIRPVLVYGPGVKANFRSMMKWVSRGVPLPLGALHNMRSLVCLDNLVDLIITCIDHPAAANQTFLVSDGEDLSVSDLLTRLGDALGRPARLVHVPAGLIRVGATVLGQRAAAERLCNSLQVDISHTCQTLGWQPPVSVSEALAKTARSYLSE